MQKRKREALSRTTSLTNMASATGGDVSAVDASEPAKLDCVDEEDDDDDDDDADLEAALAAEMEKDEDDGGEAERHERTRSRRQHANHRRASTRAGSIIKARELKRRFKTRL